MPNSWSLPLREQSNHRKRSWKCLSKHWGQESMIPTLQLRNAAPHSAKRTSVLMNSQTLLIQKDGGKGSQMETWKEIPLPSLKGQSLKARSLFFKIVCLMLNNQFALHWCYNCLLFTEMWWPHNKPSFIVISSLLLWGGGERTPI